MDAGGGGGSFCRRKEKRKNYTDAACVDWQDESRYSGKGDKREGEEGGKKNALV